MVTSSYSASKGGVTTSTGQFYPTTNPSFTPKGTTSTPSSSSSTTQAPRTMSSTVTTVPLNNVVNVSYSGVNRTPTFTSTNSSGATVSSSTPPQGSTSIQAPQTIGQKVQTGVSNIITKAQSTWDTITGKTQRDIALQSDVNMLQSGRVTIPFTATGQGTPVTIQKPISTTDIEKATFTGRISTPSSFVNPKITTEQGVSRTAAVIAGGQRLAGQQAQAESFTLDQYAKQLETQSKNNLNKVSSNEQTKIDTLKDTLQNKVNNNLISVNDANSQLKSQYDSSNQILKSASSSEVNKATTSLQAYQTKYEATIGKTNKEQLNKYINNLQSKANLGSTLELTPVIVTSGVITGAAIGVVGAAATGGSAVASGVLTTADILGVGLGGVVAYEGGKQIGKLGASIIQGSPEVSTNARNLAALTLQVGGFVGGSVIGSRMTSGVKLTSNEKIELNKALDRAKIETSNIGINTESQISKLSMSDSLKLDLIKQLNSGNKIEIVKSKINPSNPIDSKLINKALPDVKIEGIRITDRLGRNINSNAIIRTEVSKGAWEYKTFSASESQGMINPSGTYDINTLTALKNDKVIATRQIGKTTSEMINENTGLSKSKGINIKYGETVLEKFKLSDRQKMDLTSGKRTYQEVYNEKNFKQMSRQNDQIASLFESKPIIKSTTEGSQVSQTISKRLDINKLQSQTRNVIDELTNPVTGKKTIKITQETPEEFLSKMNTKSLVFGKSKAEPYNKPIPFDINAAEFYGSKSKTPIYQKENKPITEKQIKDIEKSTGNLIQTEGTKGTNQLDLKELDTNIFDVETITKESLKSIQQPSSRLDLLYGAGLEKKQQMIGQDLIFNQLSPTLNKAQIQPQLSMQQLTPKQIQKFNLDILNPNININIPEIPPFNIPEIPLGGIAGGLWSGSPERGKGYSKGKTKDKPEYTADISSAFFGITKNVTPEQYKELQKATFTGAEYRPVLNIVTKKGGSTQEGTIRNLKKAIENNQRIIKHNQNRKQITYESLFS